MYLNNSGADFLERSNAKRIEKNKLKLQEIKSEIKLFYDNCEKNDLNPQCLWLSDMQREENRLKSLIFRAGDWLNL